MGAREFYSSHSATEVATTSTTEWATVGQLQFQAKSSVDYVVFWSFEGAKAVVTNSSLAFRVAVDGVAVDEGQIRSRTASDYPLISGFLRVQGAGLRVVTIDIINMQGANLVLGRNASLAALALDAGDRYAEDLSRIETTSSSATPLVSVTASSGGAYLLLGMSFTDNNNTTAPTYGSIAFEGATGPTYMVGHGNLADVRPLWGMWRQTAAEANTPSIQWCGRSHVNGAICGWRSNRVLALRMDRFDADFYADEIVNAAGTEASFVEALPLAVSQSANPHLVLAAFQTASASNTVSHAVRITEDGAEIGRGAQRTYASSAARAGHQGFVAVREGRDGARRWTLDRASDGVSSITLVAGSSIAALDLGAAGKAVDLEPVAVSLGWPNAALKVGRRFRGALAQLVVAGLANGLAKGLNCRASARSHTVSAEHAQLARGTRLAPTPGSLGLENAGALLVRELKGLRLTASRAEGWFGWRAANLRTDRRVAGARGRLDWARLEGVVRRILAMRADDRAYVLRGGDVEWPQVFVMRPAHAELRVRTPAVRLAYSGQRFWQAVTQTAETWLPASRAEELWDEVSSIPEVWS